MKAFRSAIDADDDTTCSMTAVSLVRRLAISDGRFSSKNAGIEAEQVALDGHAQVGDDALADPADVVEAHTRRHALHRDDAEQRPEIGRDDRRVGAGMKALVDDQLQPLGHRQRRAGGDDQGNQRQRQVARILPDEAPQQLEPAELPRRRRGVLGGGDGHRA